MDLLCIERITDHATNIAEDVIYIVRGVDVRERGDKELRKGLRQPAAPRPDALPPRSRPSRLRTEAIRV